MCLLNIVHLLSLMHSPNKDSGLKIPLQQTKATGANSTDFLLAAPNQQQTPKKQQKAPILQVMPSLRSPQSQHQACSAQKGHKEAMILCHFFQDFTVSNKTAAQCFLVPVTQITFCHLSLLKLFALPKGISSELSQNASPSFLRQGRTRFCPDLIFL